ncbi:MAG: uridine kinase, partial [Clostridia bacterium]|nr:uridine kinase [Clostridia bacterium]
SPVRLPSARLTVVEGSYSLLPELRQYYDLTVFCDVSRDVQRRRITEREKDRAEIFFERWIPLEERYFSQCDVAGHADIILNMENTLCSD